MSGRKPTITTTQDVVSFVHNLRSRLQDRNQDFRTLSHTKALHAISEAKDYENWQQYSAALLKSECLEILTSEFNMDAANAGAAWNTLTSDAIRHAQNGRELAEELAHTYASVPLPASKPASKEAALNKAMLEDCLDCYERLNRGEDVEDLGVYGSKVSGIEICLVLGSASAMYLLVDSDGSAKKGRIETSGWGVKDTLELDADQLIKIEDLFHIEIESELSKTVKD